MYNRAWRAIGAHKHRTNVSYMHWTDAIPGGYQWPILRLCYRWVWTMGLDCRQLGRRWSTLSGCLGQGYDLFITSLRYTNNTPLQGTGVNTRLCIELGHANASRVEGLIGYHCHYNHNHIAWLSGGKQRIMRKTLQWQLMQAQCVRYWWIPGHWTCS